nr:ATP synthase F0 subunit 8 [Craseoschema thyasiricola]UJV31467.1 ATP synthase F0 subunit 8 [Craseoschema thyasiricola]
MPQISPLPWILTIVSLGITIYILHILMWYSTPPTLKFNKST